MMRSFQAADVEGLRLTARLPLTWFTACRNSHDGTRAINAADRSLERCFGAARQLGRLARERR